MATRTRRAPAPKIRVTSKQIAEQRANYKRDLSPKWDGAADWSGAQFTQHFRAAMNYYNMNNSGKDLKPQVINWMGNNGYTKSQIDQFKRTKDWRCQITMGAIAACLNKGMPAIHPGFNNGKDTAEWLRTEIEKVTVQGKEDFEPVVEEKTAKITAPVVTIQDRLREASIQMTEELETAIDSFLLNPNEFDPKSFKILNLLRGKGAKAAHIRYIKGFFQYGYDELMELATGNADEQLREAYRHNSRKNIKKLIEFYESIIAACEQIVAEAKVIKQTRTKKVKPVEEQVKKLKFCLRDDKLNIVSVPPAGIIAAQGVVVFNVKTRKIGYYVSKTSTGLAVKGTTIINFTDKSFQKTLRRPAEQIKEFKEQTTQKRFETWFSKNIKTTETKLTGRINEDTIILKIYK